MSFYQNVYFVQIQQVKGKVKMLYLHVYMRNHANSLPILESHYIFLKWGL